ncbi:hypothetical protein SAMN03080594_102260 [Arenibacter palladensis]|uniref:Uncharacterized protein n=1 Tax=Arenibacter palladensis TaxID=237373 RepID=A0A1M4XZT6_9FLAO|nr:hypothetical protein [Arenibacter palladensis]SHE98948.1 hypothetical protein SAMN03080594_102260 [Arenibacter palladensis]
MRKHLALLQLLVLHVQPVANGFVLLEFLLNQDYIKEFLCVNKDDWKLACNGKCYLMQQLSATQNEKEEEFPILYQTKIEFILVHFQTKSSEIIYFVSKKEEPPACINDYVFLLEYEIFHPPII